MIKALFEALGAGLELWGTKESRKYLDKLIRLEKEYYEESNLSRPDMAKLDNIKFELRLLSKAFAAEARKPDPLS